MMKKKKKTPQKINRKKIPEAVLKIAAENGMTKDTVKAKVKLDRGRDNTPLDCYIFFDGRELLFLSGINILVKKEELRRFFGKNVPLEAKYKSLSVDRLNVEGWRDFEVEQQISGCIITAVNEFGGIVVTNLSNTTADDARDFCTEVNIALGCKDESERRRKEEPECCPKCGKPYPNKNRKVCPKCIDRAGVIKRYWYFTKKYKFQVLTIFAAMVLSSALTILAPYVSSGFFYDSVLTVGGKFYGEVLLVIG
ncbi:MAG: hypothetical protein IKU19_09560, partial [Clostridia bacterium]|nr:hypothetical protein [Clostridia bacterium]